MNKLRIIYGITAIVCLLVLAISPFKDYFSEWRRVQKNYNRYIEKLPQKVKPVPIALQQIWARKLNQVDRCIVCHTGITNSQLANAPQPYRNHPAIPHDMEEYGCTICHQGQGLATNYKDAHLPSEFWDKPVLPNRYVESSCGRCHLYENLELTPALNLGRQEVNEQNCAGCHDLPARYSKSFIPSLDGVGTKVISRSWIKRWLTNPGETQPQTKMPDFMLSQKETDILTDFLMSFKSFSNDVKLDSLPEIFLKNKSKDDFIALGKTRFSVARCISCHAVEGKGGHLAPDLVNIASKATPQWIYNYIMNCKKLQPGVEMPQFGFSTEEGAEVTAYIESEFVDFNIKPDTTSHQLPADFFEQGIALFNHYNCGGCHSLSSDKVSTNRGPDLTSIGSKRIYQIDFGTSGIPHTLYNFLEAKINTPRSFGESARMPKYRLDKTHVESITAALLSFRSEPLPSEFIRSSSPPEEFNPQGNTGSIIKKYSCLKCHTINRTGGTIAPDLSYVGSQLQREWTEQYFKIPYSIRPIVEERMPNLSISGDEIRTLADYFYTVLVNDSIEVENNINESEVSPQRGRELYYEKFGCQSCHILEGKGGYVGPPLDDSGNRLQPGWIFKWLMNPQKYKPGTLEPRSGMTRAEARDLTAYLMSFKKQK
jgi:mono/diheme cytochrome c family protein/cytochrome c551/c552